MQPAAWPGQHEFGSACSSASGDRPGLNPDPPSRSKFPYGVRVLRPVTELEVPGAVKTRVAFEPVTRVAGAIALRTDGDSATGRYGDTQIGVQFHRGYETILSGRDLRDAVYTASRCCGYHGGQHALAAAQAVEMAGGLTPPPMAVAIRNLGLAAESIHAEAAHLVLMVGPDLCEQTVRANWPALWAAAETAEAPHAEIHGMGTIGEIMYSLNPLTGKWYKEAFNIARVPYTMYSILFGKYPHPQAIVPGGVATTVSTTIVHDYLIRLLSLVDPAKRVGTLLVDLIDFCLATVPALAQVGVAPANFLDSGQWDDPEGYDPSWEGLAARGDRRWAAPGVIVDGKLVTANLREIVEGVEESVEHSYYRPWPGASDPFSKRTLVAAGPATAERYSWSTSARWRGQALETGAGARLWATALRGSMPGNPLITAENGGIQLDLPQAALPRLVLEWKPPAVWNALERDRARLYSIVFAALVAANQVLKVLDLQKQARGDVAVPYRAPKGARRGAGFAGDGMLGHWLTTDGGRIDNYQVVAPSTFNLGPGGPAEMAINGTPFLGSKPSGLEALIALRSFDPCGNCASH